MTFADVFKAWKQEHYRNVGEKSVATYDRAFTVFEPLHKKSSGTLKRLIFRRS